MRAAWTAVGERRGDDGVAVTRRRAVSLRAKNLTPDPPSARRRRRRRRRGRPTVYYYEMLSANGITSFVAALVCALSCIADADANIDCFKCVSLEWQNRACDDPFHNNFSSGLLESPCMGGRKGRNGLFPATACIKLTGYYQSTGQHVTVRGCALDSGTLTTDTEIIRMSHCGGFYFDDKYVEGCLQSCDDADGCNPGSPPASSNVTLLMALVVMPLVVVVVGLVPGRWADA